MQALPPPDAPQAIIVTARALPQPVGERVLHTEAWDEKALRTAPSLQLERLLDRFAGVQQFRRSDSRSGHPTGQGVTLRALGGNAASRAQLILDGVPQSDPFGGWIAWPALDSSDLAEIRLTRGGGNVVHGPGALAGAIQLTSSIGAGVAAGVDGGSRDSIDAHASMRENAGAGLFAIALRGSRGDGFIPVTDSSRGTADRSAPYRNGGARARWVVPIGTSTELQTGLSAFADRRERGLRYTANRSRGGDASVRIVSRNAWAWSLLAYGQLRNFRSSFATVDPQRNEARRVSLQYNVPGRSAGWSAEMRPPVGTGVELRIGADGRWMRGESREFANYVSGVPQRQRSSGGKSAYTGLFSELSVERGPVLLTGSARLDRWTVARGQLIERAAATGDVLSDTRYGAQIGWSPTGRVAGALALSPKLSLRGAAYAGWRLPTLNELFRPFRAGSDATAANPLLEPERLRGAEAGLNWKSGDVALSVTGFTNRLNDAIGNVTLGSGPGIFPGVGFLASGGAYRQRRNLGAIHVQGVEASGQWTRGPWRASVSGSFADARVQSSGTSVQLDGLRPAQTPRVAVSASGGWEQERRSLTLLLHYEGRRFEDDLNRQRLPSALTVDAAAGLPLGRKLTLMARAENLLDARVTAGIAGDGIVERASPRTLWLGLRLSDAD